jgi:hypothetical protein
MSTVTSLVLEKRCYLLQRGINDKIYKYLQEQQRKLSVVLREPSFSYLDQKSVVLYYLALIPFLPLCESLDGSSFPFFCRFSQNSEGTSILGRSFLSRESLTGRSFFFRFV